MFLFNILCSLLFVGKHVWRSLKNIFPMLVATFTRNGGLNQIMFLFRILFLLFSSLFSSGGVFISPYLQTIYSSNKIVEHFRGIMITDLDLSLSRNPDQPLEQINLGYSTKNIPTCSEKQYIKSLINRTEQFVKNVRWKAFSFLNPDLNMISCSCLSVNFTRYMESHRHCLLIKFLK